MSGPNYKASLRKQRKIDEQRKAEATEEAHMRQAEVVLTPSPAEYVCDHDYCDLEECRCKCHQDAANSAIRDLASVTDQPLSQSATIRRQHHLICELRERANKLEGEALEARKAFLVSSAIQAAEVKMARKWHTDRDRAFETLRAIAVEGLGLSDPWADTSPETAPPEWSGLLSEKVAQLRMDAIFWKGKFEQEERLRDAPKLTSQVGWQEPDQASLEYVLREVTTRRRAQDRKHGGPEHDDTHTPGEWLAFIREFTQRAHCAWLEDLGDEDRLLDVAALAVAAIQSSRRKRKS